mmetsp:Transcript_5674/g.8309  ORF Transcript_5674/g.8309 Transcript_5674/m.8309 type:complete len:119 (-) Transcript_5674:158-514(-)
MQQRRRRTVQRDGWDGLDLDPTPTTAALRPLEALLALHASTANRARSTFPITSPPFGSRNEYVAMPMRQGPLWGVSSRPYNATISSSSSAQQTQQPPQQYGSGGHCNPNCAIYPVAIQ